ncbi:hypothetical protein BDZ89DRAFT_45572 [Hymenopellis radicata]|nr:hypothetical protein BDZ89DRAFT_45572 [Hymenopellis radicata]
MAPSRADGRRARRWSNSHKFRSASATNTILVALVASPATVPLAPLDSRRTMQILRSVSLQTIVAPSVAERLPSLRVTNAAFVLAPRKCVQ